MAYTREMADRILSMMAEGMTLRETCRTLRKTDTDAPSAPTVRLWVVQDIDGIAERYARARDALMMHWADEIVATADDSSNDWMVRQLRGGGEERVVDREHVSRSALRIDARKWLLSKLHPNFAEKIRAEHTGANGGPIQTQAVDDARPSIETFLNEFTTGAPRNDTQH